jgi:hypothetical protein
LLIRPPDNFFPTRPYYPDGHACPVKSLGRFTALVTQELASLKARLTALADEVLEGSVDRGNAAVVGQLLNTVIRAIGMEMRVREVEDLQRQVEELRELIEVGRSQGQRSYGA